MTLVPAVLALLGRRAWQLPRWLEYRLPALDPEGATVAHQLRLQEWPGDHPDDLVSVENLEIRDSSGDPVAAVDELHVGPGEVAVLDDDDPHAAHAVLNALSGRLGRFAGDVKVAGHVLPNEARIIRRAVPIVSIARPVSSGDVIFVDGLDEILHSRREYAEDLRADVAVHLDSGGCVVATARRVDDVRSALPGTTVRMVDVAPGPEPDAPPDEPDPVRSADEGAPRPKDLSRS